VGGETKIKAKLSPAKAGAELGNKAKLSPSKAGAKAELGQKETSEE
jgi:hypothetical protein